MSQTSKSLMIGSSPVAQGATLFRSPHGLLLIAVALFAVISIALPDVAMALTPTAVEESMPSWAVICAACVGFALGAGIFALPALLAFLMTPAGEMALVGCVSACIEAT